MSVLFQIKAPISRSAIEIRRSHFHIIEPLKLSVMWKLQAIVLYVFETVPIKYI